MARNELHQQYGVVFDDHGKGEGMFGTVQDVTERKCAEIECAAAGRRIPAFCSDRIGSFERRSCDWQMGVVRMSLAVCNLMIGDIERGT